MSTRSLICAKNDDGSISVISTKRNGEWALNGDILFENYRDEKKVRDLIEKGNLVELVERPDDCETFDEPPAVYQDFAAFTEDRKRNADWFLYAYLFDPNAVNAEPW